MVQKLLFTFALLFFITIKLSAGDVDSTFAVEYTLQELIAIARERSISALRAETEKENKYWQWRTFKSNYMPQLSLSGVLPDFNRKVKAVEQNDGTIDFVEVFNNSSSLTLSVSQAIGLTGGTITINSDLQRFDDFSENKTIYSGNPAFIGIWQPLFAFNWLEWDKKINPLRYEESKRDYIESLEDIAVRTTELFFNLLLNQISMEIAKKNLANNDTIYKLSQQQNKAFGKIVENKLLQLEAKLQLVRSRQEVAQAQVDLKTSTLQLRSYVGITDPNPITLILPTEIPEFYIDPQLAIEEALRNRQEAVAFERQKLEAERRLAQAKGDNGLNAELYATFGLTNRGNEVPEIYLGPEDQQTVRIGLEIPIVDWGRSKSRIKTADANKKLVAYSIEQDKLNFKQEIVNQVNQFEILVEKVKISTIADDIALQRYEITKNRYLEGKEDITKLNIALNEKDQAKKEFIASLRSYWTAYYRLRRLTLYDFENQVRLVN